MRDDASVVHSEAFQDPRGVARSMRATRMSLPPGYLLPEGKTMQDILRMDAEMLVSEGIDPAWPGFEGPPEDSEADSD
jgi:hypothetical protein